MIDGRRLISAALDAGVHVELFYTSDDEPLAQRANAAWEVTPALLREIASTTNPPDVVAVAQWEPLRALPERKRRVLVLNGVSDPGNAGTLARTAVGLGCDTVVFTKGSCDVGNPKVLRGTAGSIFGGAVVAGMTAADVLKEFRTAGLTNVGAVAHGGAGVKSLAHFAGRPWALWIGSEADGLSPDVQDGMDVSVSVSVCSGVESLNAAAAGAIILYVLTGGNVK